MRQAGLACAIAIVGLGVACSPPGPVSPKAVKPAAPTKTAEAPKPAFDFDAFLRREAPALAVTKLDADVLSADVEAASAPQVTHEKGSIHVAIPIGTMSTIDCYVYDEPKDGAATMLLILDEVKKSLEIKLFAPTDVFVAGEHPALASHAIYLGDKDGVKVAGELKLVYYRHPLVPALCMHDEPGYTATFKRITKRFFETAQRRDRELRNKSTSWEVSVVKIDGRPVGFDDRQTYEQGTNHLTTSVSVSSSLWPRSPVACMAEDTVTTRTVDASGELLESAYVKGSGPEVDLQVDVKRLSPAHYAYSGRQSGKPIAGKFKTVDKHGLATDPIIKANVKQLLLTGRSTSFKMEEYVPSIDPTAAIETLYEIESKEQRRIRASFGPVKMTVTVDGDGQPEHVVANVGNAHLTIERLAAGGKR